MKRTAHLVFNALAVFAPVLAIAAAPHSVSATGKTGVFKLTLVVYDSEIHLTPTTRETFDSGRMARDRAAGIPIKDIHKYRTTTSSEVAEPVWVKVELTNIGRRPVKSADALFVDGADVGAALMFHQQDHRWTYFSLTEENGREVPARTDVPLEPCPRSERSGPASPAVVAQVARWRKDGLTNDEINARLRRQEDEDARRHEDDLRGGHPYVIEPGQTVVSRVWAGPDTCGSAARIVVPPDGFLELPMYRITAPGEYYLTAYYSGFDGKAWVRVRTPRIRIRVGR